MPSHKTPWSGPTGHVPDQPAPDTIQLEEAIAAGDTDKAVKLVTKFVRKKKWLCIEELDATSSRTVKLQVNIEDKDTSAGHVLLDVTPSMLVSQLKIMVFQSLGFPPEVQRWIISSQLVQDSSRLSDLLDLTSSTTNTAFLYLMSAGSVGLTCQVLQNDLPTPAQDAKPPNTGNHGNHTVPTPAPRPIATMATRPPLPLPVSQIWICLRCTYQNKAHVQICEMCDATCPQH